MCYPLSVMASHYCKRAVLFSSGEFAKNETVFHVYLLKTGDLLTNTVESIDLYLLHHDKEIS
ncbi:hypothetical protein GGR09_001458 [Bartonella heixiaziensis]